MNTIVIVGAGDIGRYIASILSKEQHNIIMIDHDRKKLEEVSLAMDVAIRHGSGTDWQLLEDLQELSPDLLIAQILDFADRGAVLEIIVRITGGSRIFRGFPILLPGEFHSLSPEPLQPSVTGVGSSEYVVLSFAFLSLFLEEGSYDRGGHGSGVNALEL